ncbi:hypothetical protein SAMN02745196_02350 [Clostridium collagenovorans DSM 3089]|uniref:Uncharacterized protein n=1 Tax=Clostridium collagenovorans DSM 3089 TaxID=1121306 RepID=A0A1M5XPR6_9CLOT|nr:hypothetical protein [Clostridium collagenovorans]SHI01524.1 hypothetical protein SAMN02745196_02350 [Clostridium collagenovorans DSM 3089]
MKKKLNIIAIFLGLILIGIGVFIGYLNDFQGDSGFLFFMLGGPLTCVGVVFTPKIWETLGYAIDIIACFFSGL